MYDTDQIWVTLAETGKFKMPLNFSEINDFRAQLHAEARDENVRLRMDIKRLPSARPNFYIYLRKIT